jgi:hypothetical protein
LRRNSSECFIRPHFVHLFTISPFSRCFSLSLAGNGRGVERAAQKNTSYTDCAALGRRSPFAAGCSTFAGPEHPPSLWVEAVDCLGSLRLPASTFSRMREAMASPTQGHEVGRDV